MKLKLLCLFIILKTCTSLSLPGQDSLGIKPNSGLNRNTVLIINSFDALSMKVRKNKKELFARLADSLKQILSSGIQVYGKIETVIVPGLFAETGSSDSSINSLMVSNDASTAIVIKALDVHFDQTGVEVTGEKHDKTRIASYDICATVLYKLYKRETNAVESETNLCEYYTERNVLSGLLAAGPDVVGKRKDAFKIIAKNAQKYLMGSF